MNDYTNGYFKMMRDIGEGYEAARVRRKAEKDALMKANDWDGVKAWNEREKNFPFPFSHGAMKAFYAFENSRRSESRVNGERVFEVSDLPWEKDVHDFAVCLKEAGVAEFAVTDQSTALMRLLHILADEEGCRMVGLCKVTRSENRWGEDGTEDYDGILMRI